MKDGVAAFHGLGQRGQVEIVATDEFEIGILFRQREELRLAGGEVVPADDFAARGRSRSTRLLPMKPAAPVKKTLSINRQDM
jgi:hypothetical protein